MLVGFAREDGYNGLCYLADGESPFPTKGVVD